MSERSRGFGGTAPAARRPPHQQIRAGGPPPPDQRGRLEYANCAAVRAAGKSPPYTAATPDTGLDRDDDGTACE